MAISDWSKRPNLTNRQSLFANRRRFGKSPVRGEFFVRGSYSSGLAPLLPVSPTGLSNTCLQQRLWRTSWLAEGRFNNQLENWGCLASSKITFANVSWLPTRTKQLHKFLSLCQFS